MLFLLDFLSTRKGEQELYSSFFSAKQSLRVNGMYAELGVRWIFQGHIDKMGGSWNQPANC